MNRFIAQGLGLVAFFITDAVAAPYVTRWQLGEDDASVSPFSQESWGSNAAPGSATVKDDDYYIAGNYAAPIGNLAVNENPALFERAMTEGDPRKRIHFPLTAAEASGTSRFRITVDLFGGGSWVNGSIPGFSSHQVTMKMNGQTVAVFPEISWSRTLVMTVPASAVAAGAGENVLQIERTGGGAGGYISFDFLKLEVASDALADADGDGMARWFEETYGLNDADPSDASLDADGDGLSHLAEFQAGSNPTDADSDNDGWSDSQELAYGTQLLNADTDGDGLFDAAEVGSDPKLADTDGDTYPDNIELEQGSAPNQAASVPFAFPGGISLQFVSEQLGAAVLKNGEPAGFFRLPFWNASALMPSWMPDAAVLNGSKSALKNHRGQVTSAAASWSFHSSMAGYHRGPGDERLLGGMIAAKRTATIQTPVIVNLTGIPYPTYDLLVYVGKSYPGATGFLRLGTNPATDRFFTASSEPPFQGWKEIKATTQATRTEGNFVRYRNQSGASQGLTLSATTGDGLAIHGIQILRSGTDTDGDGMSDLDELEHRLNPAVADASADPDADGLSHAAELVAGTLPFSADTDLDGLRDGQEASYGTSPLIPDHDADGLTDGAEVNGLPFPSSPTLADSDGDGFSDATERTYRSNPLAVASVPPPVPVWDAVTRTWRWRIDSIRVLWNHDQSMLGAISGNETTLFEAVADIGQSGWDRQIGIGFRYVKGKLVHQFRDNSGAFHRNGAPNDGIWNSDWNAQPVDRSRAFGFSGMGPADESLPLRFEFSATQPNPALNRWTLSFLIADFTNPAAPVTLASYSEANAVAADSSLLNGTAVWKNSFGATGNIDWNAEPGVSAHLSQSPITPLDDDHDGMPNSWEITHAFNANQAADAALDADADGLANLREFLVGTHPRDADSDDDGASDRVEFDQSSDPLVASSLPAWFNFSGKIDDLNADGLSDSWLLWSGGKSRASAADDDGDGMSNLEESKAGTHPDDANSRLDLKTWRSANDLVLSWTHIPDKAQRVEVSENLGTWQLATGLPSPSVVGGRRQLSIPSVFPSSATGKFYRAGVMPLDLDLDGVEDWAEVQVLGSSTTDAGSLAQAMPRFNGQSLSGDAVAQLERLQGSVTTGGGPGSSAPGMPSAVNAARFLMQSTFGPTPQSIEELRTLGYSAWLDHQVSLPASLLQPYIREIKADGAGPRADLTYNFNDFDRYVHGNNVTTPFARNAIGGEDQLRQRVAFALSQILVVSRRDANLEEKPEAMTSYYDTLVRHALGNYGDLLREMTLHPAMGWYLSHAGNQKANPAISRYPDENYAREIMQLFTIGLWELNPDGSRKLDSQGQPIPTYDNGDITELARVFTGLYFAAPYGWGGGGWEDEHFTLPMVMYPEHHDFEQKSLPHGAFIPARDATEVNGKQDVLDAVDALFRHPNTAPYISRQLIQFLVTDNPSPAYIQRVQQIFVNDGSGVRGNLAAVVRAILLDPEARSVPLASSFGKVREPVIRTMHLGRLFRLAQAHPKFVWWNWTDNFYAASVQEPMNSPSVFNFYTPIYQAPGEIRNAGFVSPGFQIINTYSSVAFPNLLWDYLHDGFQTGGSWKFPLDYRSSLLLAENPAALLDQVDLLICAGNMTARTRGILRSALANPSLSAKDRVALAVWTALTCPEGVVQK